MAFACEVVAYALFLVFVLAYLVSVPASRQSVRKTLEWQAIGTSAFYLGVTILLVGKFAF